MVNAPPPPGSRILVIAQSARAIAASAARAGYRPLTLDHFADDDTRQIAERAERVAGGLSCGFSWRTLRPAIDRLLDGAPDGMVAGLVLGSGFEDRPRLVDRLAARFPLFGCPGETIAAVKAPESFADALGRLGLPHPAVVRRVPDTGSWLIRRRGASGGGHIRPAGPGPVPPHHFAQSLVPGRPISALVAADGRDGRVNAFSRQWADPTPEAPYRFAGLVGPIAVDAGLAADIGEAAARLARHFALRGLVSLDVMVDGDRWWLLEINPRIGASIDALDDAEGGLFEAHLAGCAGAIRELRPRDATIRATMVVYARTDTRAPRREVWPPFAMDRSAPGTAISAGDPIATVIAEAADPDEAEALARDRARQIRERVGEAPT